MKFDSFFRFISYSVVFCGFLSLWATGGIGFLFSAGFLALLVTAWFFEKKEWQISERIGTGLVVLVVPLFVLVWKYKLLGVGTNESALAAVLARVILGLSLIKLFQKKADRDWIFLYLMAFFEILLSAALSISPLYLAVLIIYLLVTVLAVITFEIRKTSKLVNKDEILTNFEEKLNQTPFKKLPATSLSLIVFIIICALPLFFMLPRVGGAGLGANERGLSGMTGFSEKVRLGDIGLIQQSDETVMRVKIETQAEKFAAGLRWRGIALDHFDNFTWKQSDTRKQPFIKGGRESILVGFRSETPRIIVQTFYLEPMDNAVLFALPKPLFVQGNLQELRMDLDDGLSAKNVGFERYNYSVISDFYVPSPEKLRNDNSSYTAEEFRKYTQLPADLDPRIGELAEQITAQKVNRYDKAKAVEEYLQTQFGYTLDQKSGGAQPVADFLFNVREGHCEYFSSSMVLMLRKLGIAARVVNGFQQGEYNETADVYIVKQKDAHSWVEVYFPKEKTWVAFDPTPFAGQNPIGGNAGFFSSFGKYLDALETYWIQYFVAFDNQEQRSLFKSFKENFNDFQTTLADRLSEIQIKIQDWWGEVRGANGFQASLRAIATGLGILIGIIGGFYLLRFIFGRLKKLSIWAFISRWFRRRRNTSVVEFYERMQSVLARNGFIREVHQTPLEFAYALGMPQAVKITEKYHRVRFGDKLLSTDESDEIEKWLIELERAENTRPEAQNQT